MLYSNNISDLFEYIPFLNTKNANRQRPCADAASYADFAMFKVNCFHC